MQVVAIEVKIVCKNLAKFNELILPKFTKITLEFIIVDKDTNRKIRTTFSIEYCG